MSRRAAGRTRRSVVGLQDHLLVLLRDGALICNEKARTHLDAGSAQHKGGRHATAVGNTAGSHYGNVDRIDDLRHQCHRRGLANMAARFGALGNNRCGSTTRHETGERHRSHNGDDLDARIVPSFHVLGGITGTSHHNGHLLIDHNLCNLVGKRAHEHDVNAKGLIRLGAQLMNLVAKPVGVGIHCRDDA